MKTFQDIINESNPDDIVKTYNINGKRIELKAMHFDLQSLSTGILNDNISCIMDIDKNIVSIKFSECCFICEGTGEYECEECEGEGDNDCFECGTTLSCDYCQGHGLLQCDCGVDSDEIIFEDEIDLNQGELFNSHFNK